MADYDPKILQEFADRLYSEARSTVVDYSLRGLFVGATAGAILGTVLARGVHGADTGSVATTAAVVAGLIGLAIGVSMGMRKAFWLKLEAQRTLCQLQIEKNTRRGTETGTTEPQAKETQQSGGAKATPEMKGSLAGPRIVIAAAVRQVRNTARRPSRLLAGLGIVAVAAGAWFYANRTGNQPNRAVRPAAQQIAPSPVPAAESPNPMPAQPRSFRRNLLYGSYQVQRGQMLFWSFTVPDGTTDVAIAGSFRAFGGRGNDIEVVIADPPSFENWKNRQPTSALYHSGKVSNGAVSVQGLEPGKYVIALDNRFSLFSGKQVSAAITMSGYVQP